MNVVFALDEIEPFLTIENPILDGTDENADYSDFELAESLVNVVFALDEIESFLN